MGKTFYSAILYTLQKLEVNAWQNVPTKGFLICGKEIPLCATLYSFPLGYLYPNRYSVGENKVYTSTLEYIKTYIPLRISLLLLKNDQLYFILFYFFQACLFYLPHLLSKAWEGGKIRNIISGLNQLILVKEERKKNEQVLANYIVESLHTHNFWAMKMLFIEFINLINAIGQIYFIDVFLGGEFR